jgi:integrase/recombinase XerD
MTLRHRDQLFESNQKPARDILTNTVAGRSWAGEAGLYGPGAERKYLNHEERHRVLVAAETLQPERCLFALVLAWTGARVSEALALHPASFQLESGTVSIVTLKRRKFSVREVPIPAKLMVRLDRCFGIRGLQRGEQSAEQRLWPWHRATGWRIVKHVMTVAGVVGRQACPRGLRHGFGVGMLQSDVSIHLIKRYLGHSRIATTEIYLDVTGPDERALLSKFWRASPHFHQHFVRRLSWREWVIAIKDLWSRIGGIALARG